MLKGLQAHVGVISDTHGFIRREALDLLQGSEIILHAGDVGDPKVLNALRAIAPTAAVRGNADKGTWAESLPPSQVVEVAGLHLYIIHELSALDLDPRAAGFAAVIYGHTHRPSAEFRGGVLYLNPGSAGPRRLGLPVAVAKLRLRGEHLSHEIIELQV